MKDTFRLRIYYEDTDCGGVVYYANYLRYVERARTEYFELRGVGLKGLMEEGIYFVVAEASLKYISPGRYGDIFLVETVVNRCGRASIVFDHRIVREASGETLVEASVKLVCVGRDLRPVRLRQNIIAAVTEINQDREQTLK